MPPRTLLLIDVPAPGSTASFTLSDLYVACSRGKHLVSVLTSSDEVVMLLREPPASEPGP